MAPGSRIPSEQISTNNALFLLCFVCFTIPVTARVLVVLLPPHLMKFWRTYVLDGSLKPNRL